MSFLERLAVNAGLAVRTAPAAETAPAPAGGPTPAGTMPPARSSSSLLVTPSEALTLDAVYRAVMILETAALQLTVDVWRGPDRVEPTPLLAARPNVADGESAGSFWADTVGSLATRGNAYWHKRRGVDGSIVSLEVIPPLEVTPWRDRLGRKRFAWRDVDDLTTADVQHLKLVRVPGEELGLGPLQAAQRTMRGHLDVAGYGAEWFRSGEVPSGVLSTDQSLTPAQAQEWSAQWRASREAAGHGTAVLGNGLKYQHLNLKPADVQWLESQRFSIASVARLFGIPSRQLLVAIEGSSTTYANAEQEDIAFVRYTLMAYLREIELALSAILPGKQTARFNVDALLRTDTLTRYQAHEIGIRAGFLTVAEVRAIEGLPAPTQPTTTPAPAQEAHA